MKKFLLTALYFLPILAVGQEMKEPLIIPQLYTWRISPNGKWLAGGSNEACDLYNMEDKKLETYYGGRYKTVTNDGVIATGGSNKPSLLIDGEVVVPESLQGARSGSVQLISSSGNRLCGSINYPDAGINGFYACAIDENGVVGEPRPIPRPSLDFFGCKPQFVNMLEISADGSTITGFVQDWRGYYCYPIIYRENEEGDWEYSYPTQSLFNPENLPIPSNPWLEEPKYPEFTDFMTPVAKTAYEEALTKFYMGQTFEYPDARDFMTDEQWQKYYDAAVSYNEWFYSHQDEINSYDADYNEIIYSSAMFDLNEVAISPDGSLIGCSYYEYPGGVEVNGIMKINTLSGEAAKYETDVYELYTTQILSDGTMLMSQPMIYEPGAYILLPDQNEIIGIKDYFELTHPEYLPWMNKYLENTGTMYANDDLTLFVGSMLAVDCDKTEEITGGYYSFTYVFGSDNASVHNIESAPDNRYRVFSLQGIKILDTENKEDLNKLPKGIYVVNGKAVIVN